MLLAGIAIRNISPASIAGLTPDLASKFRNFGLALILLRSGLEIDFAAFARIGWVAVRLTAMPGISEALAAGVAGWLIFGMPPLLGLSMGFILAAVSPAVVVVGMF